jgi:hypothetical protein
MSLVDGRSDEIKDRDVVPAEIFAVPAAPGRRVHNISPCDRSHDLRAIEHANDTVRLLKIYCGAAGRRGETQCNVY